MCVWFSLRRVTKTFLILRRTERDLEKYSNMQLHKIRPVIVEMFHADRRTYITKLVVTFRNSTKAPKNIHKALRKKKNQRKQRTPS
jgi:hypothetical protein